MKMRPSGKTLRVSILAVLLAACVALGVYIHSLSPEIKLDGLGRDLAGLGKLTRSVAGIELKGFHEFDPGSRRRVPASTLPGVFPIRRERPEPAAL